MMLEKKMEHAQGLEMLFTEVDAPTARGGESCGRCPYMITNFQEPVYQPKKDDKALGLDPSKKYHGFCAHELVLFANIGNSKES